MTSYCAIALDLDGTLIPILVDFERLRKEIRALLGVDHPLRPLGESLASLGVDEELKRRAWELIEDAERESVGRLDPGELAENVSAIKNLLDKGFRVFIVTMRSRSTATAVLERLGLESNKVELITRDVSLYRVNQLKTILERTRGFKLVFIGDTVYDELAARALGISFVRVASYRDLPKVLEKAVELCQSPS